MPAEATFTLLAAPLSVELAEAEADEACWPPCVPVGRCGRPGLPLLTVDTSESPRTTVVDLPTLTVKEVRLPETLRGMVA